MSKIDFRFLVGVDLQGRLVGRWFPDGSTPRKSSISSCAYLWDVGQSEAVETPFAGMSVGWPDVQLVPTEDERLISQNPSLALVLAETLNMDGTSCEVASKTILDRQIARLSHLDIQLQIGYELEFYIRPRQNGDERGWSVNRSSFTTRRQDVVDAYNLQHADFLRDAVSALERAKVEVLSFQSEWGIEQWELTTKPTSPQDAAASICIARIVLQRVALKHGLAVSFMAKPATHQPGSSAHMHISLSHVDGTPVPTAILHSGLAGVLALVQDFTLLYAPNVNSYRRIHRPYAGCGSTWGVDNRTTTVRMIESNPRRFEFRLPGADVNPYLCLAALAASVAHGVMEKLPLGPGIEGNAYREEVGGVPWSLWRAADALENSPLAHEWLGKNVTEHLVSLARFEASEFDKIVTDWEVARYCGT